MDPNEKTPPQSTEPQFTPLLKEAAQCVQTDRISQYGEPEDCFKLIAQLWSSYTGHEISPRQTCMMMVLVKIARDANAPKFDNLVDMVGYALCIERGDL